MLNSIYRKIFQKTTPVTPISSDLAPVYFFTFHKCASSLFSNYILHNITGLQNVDIASKIYNGVIKKEDNIPLDNRGCIYGPIRISVKKETLVYQKLVLPTTNTDFIKSKRAIFFVRDPRDILVSSYFSFGFTHRFSKIDEIRELQKSAKNAISGQDINEYVIANIDKQIMDFTTLMAVFKSCDHAVMLRYEDMINDFDQFISDLSTVVHLDDKTIKEIYRQSRPVIQEDSNKHKRSGKVGGYQEKLSEVTINELNTRLDSVLAEFNYK